jgi:hypothetical protein
MTNAREKERVEEYQKKEMGIATLTMLIESKKNFFILIIA